MTLTEACLILKDYVVGSDLQSGRGDRWIEWERGDGNNAIGLDGDFTLNELEAIIVFMKEGK